MFPFDCLIIHAVSPAVIKGSAPASYPRGILASQKGFMLLSIQKIRTQS